MHRFLFAAALIAVAFFPGRSGADPCGQRVDMAAELARDWGEAPRFRGLTAQGDMLEIFLGASGSWSVVVTRPDGVACLVAAGEDGSVFVTPTAVGGDS